MDPTKKTPSSSPFDISNYPLPEETKDKSLNVEAHTITSKSLERSESSLNERKVSCQVEADTPLLSNTQTAAESTGIFSFSSKVSSPQISLKEILANLDET
ncbi:MAG: hypothetical protein ACI9S8_000981 [Chlamydiales bacterium]|jgi:hypothetical protein